MITTKNGFFLSIKVAALLLLGIAESKVRELYNKGLTKLEDIKNAKG